MSVAGKPLPISIHPTAIIDPECEFGEGVEIGPWCVLTGRVVLGDNVRLLSNVQISGPVTVGASCTFYPFVSIGFPPQDFKFKPGDPTAGVTIGSSTVLRESVSVHAATRLDKPTRIGDRVYMMANSHAGHDVTVGNGVVMANSALLAGHCSIGDNAIISGNSAVHQFNRVGRMAFISGNVGSSKDIPPFCVCAARNTINTVNLVGLRRAGYPREQITSVRNAFWYVFRRNLLRKDTITELMARGKDCPLVMEQAEFVASATRPIARGGKGSQTTDSVDDAE
ncbi:MAG: acyl-ACP--UDP-N-acetylglucosamine O-acyltransferase [bacterium]|nr:acyl-ACP--UDP-N-acetylglucosamine O-acyltransferase [bacterium]